MASGKILFFGKLADVAGAAEWPMPMFDEDIDDATLISMISIGRPELEAALLEPSNRICVNQILLPPAAEIRLTQADEVAFLPPMSGG